MTTWVLTCPNCGTANEAAPDQIVARCGKVSCTCLCTKCSTEFSDETEYWRWLGLESGPPDEPKLANKPT
jgi:hypothetical protein